MATKYYCDGCDRELAAGQVQHIDVLVVVGADQNQTPQEYELCSSCTSYLKERADPKNWPRMAEAKSA